MIEAIWRSLKSNCIYMHQPDSFTALERLISLYVTEHNTKMPHAAYQGQTPDEVYLGQGDHVPEQLAEARRLARKERLQTNRRLGCADCRAPVTAVGPSEPLPPERQGPQ